MHVKILNAATFLQVNVHPLSPTSNWIRKMPFLLTQSYGNMMLQFQDFSPPQFKSSKVLLQVSTSLSAWCPAVGFSQGPEEE